MNKVDSAKRLKEIIESLKELNIEEVAEMYGYKNIKVLKSIMNRNKYSWSKLEKTFIRKIEDKTVVYTPIASTLHGKIILALSKNDGNLQETLKVTKFTTVPDLANYMTENCYKWDSKIKNYTQIASIKYVNEDEENKSDVIIPISKETRKDNTQNNEHDGIDNEYCLNFIKDNLEQLKLLLSINEVDPNGMPRYCVPGINITKSLYMVNSVSDLISRFSIERNISQKEMAEIAFIEFFRKYGYKVEINNMFS